MTPPPEGIGGRADITAQMRMWMLQEAHEVRSAAERLERAGPAGAFGLLAGCPRLVAVTGVGTSGLVAAKLAATFTSSGTAALFLHASDALHGGLGIVGEADVAIAVSKSGRTAETLLVVDALRGAGVSVIALTGTPDSPLARTADAVLDASVAAEACPLGISATASSTVALAMGHALAMTLATHRGWSLRDLARVHPAGALGSLTREEL
ncbi:SIS domain-containing protein (plasmid) [Streptomyces sp. NBC_00440]|uniref:SIS domain-containing protein n=1 Tax=unclassified Streptomyces TaxID=2593676 RepID=UPI002E21E0D8|nr:SIS domain-containing protein [Streptomyces sp. NBC_00963]